MPARLIEILPVVSPRMAIWPGGKPSIDLFADAVLEIHQAIYGTALHAACGDDGVVESLWA